MPVNGGPGDGGPWGWRPLGMADPGDGDGGPWGWRTLELASRYRTLGYTRLQLYDTTREVKYL
jgi:hypothetical protein